VYPEHLAGRGRDARLFKQFSFPGGIPSHVAPETPGSIHEGGELGYSLSHAFGAAFDNPDLLVACVVGDGEAETGPLATSWHSNKFLNPVHDGAVLPILHLNGYKIAGPTVLARISHDELEALFRGYGYTPYFVEGDDPERCTASWPPRSTGWWARSGASSATPANGFKERPRWPMIVLRSPKGWTGPKTVDGKPTEGSWRSHQVPMGDMSHPGHVKILEKWLKSYRPRELFDKTRQAASRTGRARPERRAPHERQSPRQRRPAAARPAPAGFPRLRGEGAEARRRGRRSHPRAGRVHPRRDQTQPVHLPRLQPGRNELEPLGRRVRGDEPLLDGGHSPGDDHVAPDGRVMEMLSEHQCEGWLEGYLLTGRHGFFSCYEAFIHIVDSMFNQHAKWLDVAGGIPVAPADRLAELPALVACVAAGPQRLQPPGPRLHRCRGQQEGRSCASICRPTRTRCSP
jgi:xylulose-5-phosphate/fructose-6-phosphate phosphoketolase